MLQLPVPLFVALLLFFLGIRAVVQKRINPWLIAVVFACALQNLLSVLIHHYGFTGMRMVQPVTAAGIPALIWIAFIRITQRPLQSRDFAHFLAVPAVWLASLAAPFLIDLLLPVIYAVYGIAIARTATGYHGDLPLARLSSGHIPGSVWLLLAVLLGVSAISDITISASLALGQLWLMPLVVSVASSSILLLTGLLMLFDDLYAPDSTQPGLGNEQGVVSTESLTVGNSSDDAAHATASLEVANASNRINRAANETANRDLDTNAGTNANANANAKSDSDTDPSESDRHWVEQLDNYLQETQAYLDPDLTLQKLSRKLGVPAKRLSSAINRHCQHNVSRHVNNYRIQFASEQLAQGMRVTETMLVSGFNTKSNFHREFSRVNGCTPTQYRERKASII